MTLPLVFSRDPRTGARNCGMYRIQKLDRRTAMMHWQIHKDGAAHLRDSQGRVPVAVAIGVAPGHHLLGHRAPAAGHRRDGLRRVPARPQRRDGGCRTVDLEVPAESEVVLEGYVDAGDLRPEGPFGDHTGFYTPVDDYPTFHLTGMSMRTDAIYATTIVGPPPMEDFYLGKATERLFLPILRMTLPDLVDMNLPLEGIFHNCALVSVNKRYPGHAKKLMSAIWGLGLLSLSRCVVVVDHDVDVQDTSAVAFQAFSNVDAGRDMLVVEGPVDALDHAAPYFAYGSKVGFDATRKWPGEGIVRPWPDPITMSEDVRALVDRRWDEYDIRPAPRKGRPAHSGVVESALSVGLNPRDPGVGGHPARARRDGLAESQGDGGTGEARGGRYQGPVASDPPPADDPTTTRPTSPAPGS